MEAILQLMGITVVFRWAFPVAQEWALVPLIVYSSLRVHVDIARYDSFVLSCIYLHSALELMLDFEREEGKDRKMFVKVDIKREEMTSKSVF